MVLKPQFFIRTPRLLRPYWARGEAAAAGRADIMQHLLDAIGAIGAFIAANAGIGAMGGQVGVA